MAPKYLRTATALAATLALSAGTAAAAPSGTASPEGPADMWSVSWFPNGAAEHNMWTDHRGDRVWGLPGGFAYISFRSELANGPDPCWVPDEGDTTEQTRCDRGDWVPERDYQVPLDGQARLELPDGTQVGSQVDSYSVWRLQAPSTPYNGPFYVSYLDRDDEDGDGDINERFHREVGTLMTKTMRDQPKPTSPTQNIDLTTVVDTSGSMEWNDVDFKRRDAVDLIYRSAVPGDTIGTIKFANEVTELSPMTRITDDDHAKTISAAVRPQIDSYGGTDYMGAMEGAFQQLYQDASTRGTLSSRRKLAVFLTDGKQEHMGPYFWSQYLNTHFRLTHSPGRYSWPVCVIQLGSSFSSRDVNRLKRVARQTGGWYVRATTDAALVDSFKACRGVSACEYTVHRRSWGSVAKDATLRTRSRIPAGRRLASFLVTGGNLRHDVTLIGPSGKRYHPSGGLPAGIRYKTGRSWSMYEVDGPGRGRWRVEINATGVADGETDRVITRTTVDRCGTTENVPNED